MTRSPILDFIRDKINSETALNESTPPKLITISREYGCPGYPISTAVSKALTQKME